MMVFLLLLDLLFIMNIFHLYKFIRNRHLSSSLIRNNQTNRLKIIFAPILDVMKMLINTCFAYLTNLSPSYFFHLNQHRVIFNLSDHHDEANVHDAHQASELLS